MRSFFFFKQKTAYEMRISDWSSDVCSSDLVSKEAHDRSPLLANGHSLGEILHSLCGHRRPVAVGQSAVGRGHDDHIAWAQMARLDDRSEEHTSELQSLMRISYAVFCLKKKKNKKNTTQKTTDKNTTQ